MRAFDLLIKTYDQNSTRAGIPDDDGFVLVPLGHASKQAQIELVINPDSTFRSAAFLDPEGAATISPVTEKSASRANDISPHGLGDIMRYVAGDLPGASNTKHNVLYLSQLKEWSKQPDAPETLAILLHYLRKKTVTRDLMNAGLFVSGGGALDTSESGLPDPAHLFVRFRVHGLPAPWQSPVFFRSWTHFISQNPSERALDYLTGEEVPVMTRFPRDIRGGGDRAKLISGHDPGHQGLVFYGQDQFHQASDAVTVGTVAAQKLHHALKWLIQKQKAPRDRRVFLFWQPNGQLVENPAWAASKSADPLKNPDPNLPVGALILDAATSGRLSVLYEKVMSSDDYAARINQWRQTCQWRIYTLKSKTIHRMTPSPYQIADAVGLYRTDQKAHEDLTLRLVRAILDNVPLAPTFFQQAWRRASRPSLFSDRTAWTQALSVTLALGCATSADPIPALKGENAMLNSENTDRSYLFGRLLGLADIIEARALFVHDKVRETHAARYMPQFMQRPARTWQTIRTQIVPYYPKMSPAARAYYKHIETDIGARFAPGAFNNRPLSPLSLVGFYDQREALLTSKKKDKPDTDQAPTAKQEKKARKKEHTG